MARKPIEFTDDCELPGPLRLIVSSFRSYCLETHECDDDLRAAELVGAANMAIRWIGLYAGFVYSWVCDVARELITTELRVRMEDLTKPGCPHRQPHPEPRNGK